MPSEMWGTAIVLSRDSKTHKSADTPVFMSVNVGFNQNTFVQLAILIQRQSDVGGALVAVFGPDAVLGGACDDPVHESTPAWT